MSRGLDIPKASPASVARAIFDGVEKEEEDIFPDPMSASMAESWRNGAVKPRCCSSDDAVRGMSSRCRLC